jgi:hypothetical protein
MLQTKKIMQETSVNIVILSVKIMQETSVNIVIFDSTGRRWTTEVGASAQESTSNYS